MTRAGEVSAAADVAAAGSLLAEAVLAERAERRPRCRCGGYVQEVVTRVEMVGSILAVDLHLQCSACAGANGGARCTRKRRRQQRTQDEASRVARIAGVTRETAEVWLLGKRKPSGRFLGLLRRAGVSLPQSGDHDGGEAVDDLERDALPAEHGEDLSVSEGETITSAGEATSGEGFVQGDAEHVGHEHGASSLGEGNRP